MHFWQSNELAEKTESVVINRLLNTSKNCTSKNFFSGLVVMNIEMNISDEMTPHEDLSRYLNKSVIFN